MDPNTTLSTLLGWAQHFLDDPNYGEMAQSIFDLDSWLSRGGLLPDRWRGVSLPDLQKAIRDLETALHEAQDALRDARRLLGGPR